MSDIMQLLAEGRLIRRAWSGTDARGRETMCLLSALSPDARRQRSAAACPADVAPGWLAHLIPWMNDSGTKAVWREVVVPRVAALAPRWHILSDEDWRRLDYTARRAALECARQHAGTATAAVDRVLALLRCAEAGDAVSHAERAAAAEAAAAAAAWAAAEAAWAAAEAARSAAADRITLAILDAIEARIAARETAQ